MKNRSILALTILALILIENNSFAQFSVGRGLSILSVFGAEKVTLWFTRTR